MADQLQQSGVSVSGSFFTKTASPQTPKTDLFLTGVQTGYCTVYSHGNSLSLLLRVKIFCSGALAPGAGIPGG